MQTLHDIQIARHLLNWDSQIKTNFATLSITVASMSHLINKNFS